jgi:hypothetical protein
MAKINVRVEETIFVVHLPYDRLAKSPRRECTPHLPLRHAPGERCCEIWARADSAQARGVHVPDDGRVQGTFPLGFPEAVGAAGVLARGTLVVDIKGRRRVDADRATDRQARQSESLRRVASLSNEACSHTSVSSFANEWSSVGIGLTP